ncbi:MAG: hypothetical protein HZA54_02875 [Planctomycetes bacterium]|nr:hypothetical protein [Planctomycetota bacterium]
MSLVKSSSYMDFALAGAIDGLAVAVDMVRRGGKHKTTFTRFSIGLGGVSARLSFHPEGLLAKLGKVFTGDDVQVGSGEFDAQVLVRGAPAETLAVLDHGTRARLSAFLATEGKVEGGQLSSESRGAITDPHALLECGRAATIFNGELRAAVQDAVKAIQGRLVAADRGQLSLAEAGVEAGAVSLAGEEGGLSLADARHAPEAAGEVQGKTGVEGETRTKRQSARDGPV